MILSTGFVLAILIAINALYVAAEFAAVSVRRSRIRQHAENGSRPARMLLPYIEDSQRLDRYIACCQVGITISSLVLGAFGQATIALSLAPILAQWGDLGTAAAASTAALLVLIVLTFFQMILGELVPKSLALQYPTQVALYTVVPMKWSLWVLSWFIVVLNGSGHALLALLGAKSNGHRHIHSPDEIELLIAESKEGGYLRPHEHRRLRRALQLRVRPVRQMMVPRQDIAMVSADLPFDELVRQVQESPYTRLPVYRDSPENIIGIIHTKDVVMHSLEAKHEGIGKLIRPPLTVHESINGERLLALLRERRAHQAIVVDEYGGLVGLVSVQDLLSELMGEISDEFKADELRPEKLQDGRIRLPGRMRLDEAEPWTGVLWEGEFDTVAGKVIEALGRIPQPGAQAVIDGVAVEVERMQGRAIETVIATPIASADEDGDEGEDWDDE